MKSSRLVAFAFLLFAVSVFASPKYLPVFKARQYDQGAAITVLDFEQLQRYRLIQALVLERTKGSRDLAQMDLQAIHQLDLAGFKVDYEESQLGDLAIKNIIESMQNFARSYAGFVAMDLFGGIENEPDLPIKEVLFRPLTQAGSQLPIFYDFFGGGDLRGVALNFSLTVAGAVSFVEHDGPFFLPIAIDASLQNGGWVELPANLCLILDSKKAIFHACDSKELMLASPFVMADEI